MNESRRISEREAAAYLGVRSEKTMQDWRHRKVGPAYFKMGRRVVYDTADLDAFMDSSKVTASKSIKNPTKKENKSGIASGRQGRAEFPILDDDLE